MENSPLQRGKAGPSTDLVTLAKNGDPDALGTLYDQHHQAVFRYFRSRVSDQHVAEDLTGEVFYKMLAGLPGYRLMGFPFRAWLFRIAHNLLVNHYLHESSNRSVELDDDMAPVETILDPATSIERHISMEQARLAMEQLEPSQRHVLALRFLAGLSLKETAEVIQKTEDAVKALQRRGLAALRLSLNVTQE